MTAARKLILRPIRAETRRVAALTAWVRRARPPGDAFGYHRDLHLILWTAGILTVVEGALTHLILVLIFGHPPWVWIVLGLHIYGVYLLFGLLAGMMTRPHTVDGPIVHLRNASGTHVSFPVADVDSVVLGERPEFGHSRWRTSDDGRTATIASGPAVLRVDLVENAGVILDGSPMPLAPKHIHVSADAPREFAARLTTALSRQPDVGRCGPVPAEHQ